MVLDHSFRENHGCGSLRSRTDCRKASTDALNLSKKHILHGITMGRIASLQRGIFLMQGRNDAGKAIDTGCRR
jgi:hypothetical protein